MGDREERGHDGADDAAASNSAWSRLADRRARTVDDEAAGTSTTEGPTADAEGEARDPAWRAVLRWAARPLRPVGRLVGAVGRWLGRLQGRLDRGGRGLVRLAGRPWVLVVGVVNVMVLVAALTFVLAPETAPTLPYVPVAGLEEVEEPVFDRDRAIMFVPVDDEIHAFDASGPVPRYCPRSDRLESEDGRVWSLRGEPLDGGPPLREHPVIVHDGTIYLDRSVTEPAPTAPDQGAEPACR